MLTTTANVPGTQFFKKIISPKLIILTSETKTEGLSSIPRTVLTILITLVNKLRNNKNKSNHVSAPVERQCLPKGPN